MFRLILKYKQMLLYIFFGVCTTAINTVSYHILFNFLNVANIASTIISWLLAVIFAFVTNKYFVFESKGTDGLVNEAVSFFSCRIATGVLDVIIMYVAVDILMLSGLLWKILSNIIVIILNFVASKFFIFKSTK